MSTLASVIIRDLFANRPAASIAGRLFFASDTSKFYRDNGATWDELDTIAAVQTAIQQNSYTYAADTGAANAYAVTLSPAPTIVAGSVVIFKAANTNTGASTLNVNGSGAVAIKRNTSVALTPNDIVAGQIIVAIFDGTNYQITTGATSGVTLLSEQTPSATGTVTFSSIPALYRDLKIVVRGRGDTAATFTEVRIQFNLDTGTNYDQESIILNNATNSSNGAAAGTFIFCGWLPAATAPAGGSGASEIEVFDYRGTTFHKAMFASGGVKTAAGAANLFATRISGWWANTGAISTVTVFLQAGNFVSGSVVSLYGLN